MPADPEGLRDVCEECGHPRAYHDDDACLHLEGNPLAGEGIECRCGEFVLMSDMSVSADRPEENSELTRAGRCRGTIEKLWPGHRAVLWRRGCQAMTRHPSGYCHNHRVSHTSVRP